MITKQDEKYMKKALSLAKKGLGRTTPNPAVGAVIVKDNKIVGRGYHKKAGGPHAEIFAINEAKGLCKDATIYVTLEPCNHFGKTPPCSKAILEAGIRRVVIGTTDPNPIAKGGAQFLKEKGLEVEIGCLQDECRYLIAPFIKHVKTGLPWIRTKVAMSLDGKIATRTGDSKWITCEKSRQYGHKIRNIVNAILIGKNTLLKDNPSLTTRLPNKKGKDPIRVILASDLNVPLDCKVIMQESSAPTIFIGVKDKSFNNARKRLEEKGAKVYLVEGKNGKVDIKSMLKLLGELEIQDLLVEGGAMVHGSFWDEDMVDEAFFFIAPLVIGGKNAPTAILGDGIKYIKNSRQLKIKEIKKIETDVLIHSLCTDINLFWNH